jgi:prephenate dehydrogenase
MRSFPPKPDWLRRVTVLGVGLLGGSVAMSLRRRGIKVVGYARHESGCNAALAANAVDEATTDLRQACAGSDVVVVASPVDVIAELACQADSFVGEEALLTDVGSTKARIVRQLRSRSESAASKFVAAHPIAGSEKTGVEHASESLLDGKVVIVTPENVSSEHKRLARAIEFWEQTGGRIITMSPQDHDERLAAVSHVPHLISSLLATLADDESLPLVGSGWKDMTRVAAGDPTMWTAICQHNRQAILSQLERVAEEVDALRERLQADDLTELHRWLQAAKRRKEATL